MGGAPRPDLDVLETFSNQDRGDIEACAHPFQTVGYEVVHDAILALVRLPKRLVDQDSHEFGKFHTYISHEAGGLLRSKDVGNQLGECLLASHVGCIF